MIADLDIIGSFMNSSPPSYLPLGLNTTIVAPHRKLLLTSKFLKFYLIEIHFSKNINVSTKIASEDSSSVFAV